MIFDWKNSKEEALANGIYEKEIFTTIYIMMEADLYPHLLHKLLLLLA